HTSRASSSVWPAPRVHAFVISPIQSNTSSRCGPTSARWFGRVAPIASPAGLPNHNRSQRGRRKLTSGSFCWLKSCLKSVGRDDILWQAPRKDNGAEHPCRSDEFSRLHLKR